jgi:DNA polymerase-3 subunit delta'
MSWQHIKGHEAVVQLFARAIERDRLAHAYLFAGLPGVGKRLFAGELAKALLCETNPPAKLQACDRCPACIQVAAGTHPDFFAVGRPEESLELPIELVRELCRTFALKPARGRGKVAVLDDADDLNDAAANCFLKTLEEPPPHSVLILIGSSAERQLSTIVSRCQVVRFAPLPGPAVADILRAQGIDDAKQVERLVRLSGGSPGQALALADPALWEFRGVLLKALSQPRIDSVGLARQWTRFVEEAGKDSAVQRRRAALTIRLLAEFLDDALRVAAGTSPRLAEPADLRSLEELAKRVGPDRLLDWLDRTLEADAQIDRRVQLVLVIEALADALGRPAVGAL